MISSWEKNTAASPLCVPGCFSETTFDNQGFNSYCKCLSWRNDGVPTNSLACRLVYKKPWLVSGATADGFELLNMLLLNREKPWVSKEATAAVIHQISRG